MTAKFALALAAILSLAAFPARAETITFGQEKTGGLPGSFDTALTGQGRPGRWEIVEDSTADGGRALAQLSAETTDYHFPLAVYRNAIGTDVEATIHFKPVSGRVDQAGGVVIRYVDPDDYYLARANALENNVTFYRVVVLSEAVTTGFPSKETVNFSPSDFSASVCHSPEATLALSVTRFDRLDVTISK